MAGMNVWAELSRSTSAVPSSIVASSTSRYRPVRVPVTESTSSGPGSASCRPSTAKATISVSTNRAGVHRDHRPAAVDAIGDHAGRQREHEPRQALRDQHAAMRIGLRVMADASHG